ncbi:MAG: hypothetical protein MUP47_10775 [Phycisphaerae bacterium]|nr:hypothetical protein [Phycisphaerae bacterium]
MTAPFTTEGIDNVRARPLAGGGAEVTFRSTQEGLHHQLYVNGHLAEWTEEPAQRSFFLPGLPWACRLVVVAVEREQRQTDFSALGGALLARPPWVFRVSVPRGPWRGPGEQVLLLGDHAGGQMDEQPLVVRDVWPAWAAHLGWGQDAFGSCTFGFDSSVAPGFAVGAFGAGPFGLDGDAVELEAALPEEGLHHLVVRRIQPDGRYTDGAEMVFLSTPPPAPPKRLTATAYDAPSERLTLQLERG